MKKIIRLTEYDLTRIVKKTLREMEDDDIEFDLEKRVDDEDDVFYGDEEEDDVFYDDEEEVSGEETQEFIDYVCGFRKDWCSKTKRFFSEMV